MFVGAMFEATQGPGQNLKTETWTCRSEEFDLFTRKPLVTKLGTAHSDSAEDGALSGLKSSFHTFYKAGKNRLTAPSPN